MRIVKYFVGVLLIVFVCNSSFAHNPDEINYDIVINEDTQELTIHLTPVAAFHLIQELRVALRMERVIKLEDYLSDFEAYFNQTINFKIGEDQVLFKLIESDLSSHDATLTFNLENVNSKEENYKVSVSSFTEVFKRIKNNVSISIDSKPYKCFLNKDNKECSFVIEKTEQASFSSLEFLGVGLLILMISLGIIFNKKPAN